MPSFGATCLVSLCTLSKSHVTYICNLKLDELNLVQGTVHVVLIVLTLLNYWQYTISYIMYINLNM